MKNWKTTVLAILGAGLLLAESKGWIDKQIAAFIGAVIIATFGAVATDTQSLGGSSPPPSKDEK